jgi:hypothetical protein
MPRKIENISCMEKNRFLKLFDLRKLLRVCILVDVSTLISTLVELS